MKERSIANMNPAKIVLIGVGSHSFGLMTVRDLMRSPELIWA